MHPMKCKSKFIGYTTHLNVARRSLQHSPATATPTPTPSLCYALFPHTTRNHHTQQQKIKKYRKETYKRGNKHTEEERSIDSRERDEEQ